MGAIGTHVTSSIRNGKEGKDIKGEENLNKKLTQEHIEKINSILPNGMRQKNIKIKYPKSSQE